MRLDIDSAVSSLPVVENDVAAINPDITRVLNQGIAAAQSGDRPMARTLLLNVAEADPRNVDAWLWLASISEYPEELLVFLNNVLDVDPENSRALTWKSATCSLLAKTHVQRGQTAMQELQNDYAMQCFEKAIETDQNCEMAWFWKASLLKNEDEKLECLERALSLNPENQDTVAAVKDIETERSAARMHDIKILATAGDHAQANEMLDRVLESEPENTEAWVLRSLLVRSFQDKFDAYDRILQCDPSNAYARYGFDFLSELADSVKPVEVTEMAPEATFEMNDASDEEKADLTLSAEPESAAGVDVVLGLERVEDDVEEMAVATEALPQTNAVEPGWFSDNVEDNIVDNVVDDVVDSVADPVETKDSEPVNFYALDHEVADEQIESESSSEVIATEAIDSTAVETEIHAKPATENEYVETHTWGESFADEADADETAGFSPAFDAEPVHQSENFSEYEPSPFAAPEESEYFSNTDESVHAFEPVVSPWAARVDDESSLHDTVADAPSFDETQEFRLDGQNFGDAPEDQSIHETVSSQFTPDAETYSEPEPWSSLSAESKPEPVIDFSGWNDSELPQASLPVAPTCPFCSADVDPQAFSCGGCRAVLTLSDIESLLSGNSVDLASIQSAVAKMESEWNSRQFSKDELKTLGVGHFNLKNYDMGVAYLQEALRNNPNDVILSGQLNTLAIRMGEIRKQDQNVSTQPKGKTILVVDDSATVRKLISSKLEKCGHNVLCAVDGVEAIEMIADVVPDLVLLDITMPRMDGYQVCKEIRSRVSTKDVPVVMISGRDGFFDKVRGRMAGSTDHITKPFGPETLMKTLETYLASDCGASE